MPPICRFYATGNCWRGTKCKFAHQASSESSFAYTRPPVTSPTTSDWGAPPTSDWGEPPTSDWGEPHSTTPTSDWGAPYSTTPTSDWGASYSTTPTPHGAPLDWSTSPSSGKTWSSRNRDSRDDIVQEVRTRIAKLEEELATTRQAQLEAEGGREAQLELEAIHARRDAESRVDQAVHAQKIAELEAKEAKKKMLIAVKARYAAETRAKDAEARADDAQKELELATRMAAQRERQAMEEARNAKQAQAEAEKRLKRCRCRATLNADEPLRLKSSQSAMKEDVVTIQRIVSGSLATFGPGLVVQSTICDFDNGLIEVKDIPFQATTDEIAALFTSTNTRFQIIDIRQYESPSMIATVAVGEDAKMHVARAITGQTIRNQAVTAKPLKTAVGYTLPHHYNLNISWENREKSALRKSEFCNALKRRLGSAPGITSFTVSSGLKNDSRGTATACFDSETSGEQARNSVRGLASTFLTVTIRCNLASMKYALAVPLEQYYLHETRKSIRKYGEMSAASMTEGFLTREKSLGYDWFNGWQWFDDANAKVFFGEDLRRQVPSIMMTRWDCITKTLVIYADSETGIQQASTHIDLFASQSEQSVFCDRIDRPTAISLLYNEQLEALNEEFGDGNISVDVLRSQFVVAYHGGRSLFPARQLLEEIESEEQDAEDSVITKSDAHCCLCRVSASRSRSVSLICGHEYCIPCLKKRVMPALGQGCLPITCFGDGDRCQRPIAIPIIQSLLSPIEFQALVEIVVEIHLSKQRLSNLLEGEVDDDDV